jgi:large subunit ribosomal protein L32e
MKTKKPKFLSRTWSRYAKLGEGVKKKQRWVRPKGRDNKMREKRKGYPATVSIGYRKEKDQRDKIDGKKMILINNIKDLEKVKKKEVIIIGKIGKKKKIEITKKARERKIIIYRLNAEKFLKKKERKNES